jgi:indolepyruvate ferredoxin oxidoreductase
MLLPEADKAAQEVGGSDAPITWQLHPPLLKALGRDSKIGFGPSTRPAFAALRSAKRLRGTRFDPFGRSEMRSTERVLASEFNDAMILVYSTLNADNLDAAIAISELPLEIRGFEALKMRRIGEFRAHLSEALSRF